MALLFLRYSRVNDTFIKLSFLALLKSNDYDKKPIVPDVDLKNDRGECLQVLIYLGSLYFG
jgi:hypothetical protein